MEVEQIMEFLAMTRAGLEGLAKADLTALSSVQLAAVIGEFEATRRRFEPVDQSLLADVVSRGLAGEYGCTSPSDLLVQLLHITPAEAKARLTRAAELGPRRELNGQPLGPILPETAAALRSGEISAEHSNVIIKTVRAIPVDLEATYGELVEHALVEQSRLAHPGLVAKAGLQLLGRIDPDGPEPKPDDPRREFGLRKRADGTSTPFGLFTPELTAAMTAVLDPLSKPCPATDGERDPRSAGQRRHDGLLDGMTRLLRSDLPSNHGTPVTILVLTAIEDFLAAPAPPPPPMATASRSATSSATPPTRTSSPSPCPTPAACCPTDNSAASPPAPNASPSPPETEAAASPAAHARHPGVKPTTSSPTPTADRPTWTTSPCCAATTTATSKRWAGPAR